MIERSDGLVVEAYDETADGTVDLARWCEVARSTLAGEGETAGQLDLIFVDPETMADLNREHMGQDHPTDVLAFPLDGPDLESDSTADADTTGPSLGELQGLGEPRGLSGPQGLADQSAPPRHLGDVVVCPDVAQQQADEHTGGFESELTLLVVHGVLHVLGHDHAEDDERLVMQARERHHLQRHGYGHPVPA